MPEAYIGVGSNIGDSQRNCKDAISLLTEFGIKIIKASSFYKTRPWRVADQPDFTNCAVSVETDLDPHELLRALKSIEQTIGRTETFRWGPRVIDLDILIYNYLILDDPDLVIPHRHMHERGFVLMPLAEIAPDLRHPAMGISIVELLERLEE